MATLEQEQQLDELEHDLENETSDEPGDDEIDFEHPPEQLALPGIDSRTIDAIEVVFGGKVVLNRSDPADCELIRRLRLGTEVSLRVDGLVIQRAGRTAHDRDGYFQGCTLKTAVRVTSVSRPAGEQLDLDDADGQKSDETD